MARICPSSHGPPTVAPADRGSTSVRIASATGVVTCARAAAAARYSAWRNRCTNARRPRVVAGFVPAYALPRDPTVFQLAGCSLVGSLAQVDERVLADVHGVSSGVSS